MGKTKKQKRRSKMGKTKKQKLRVVSMSVQNVLGLEEFAMEPGKISVIKGKNGTGKTSLLETMKNVYNGGSLAKIAHLGDDGSETDPKVVIVMEESSGQRYLIEKTAKGAKVKAQVGDSAGFEDVPSPQRFLSGLFDGTMSNPIAFLNAKEKDRVLMLLGALPLELDRAGLWESMGITKKDVAPVPEGLHPLQEMGLIRESVFRERTGMNRDEKQKRATAEQTRRATPAVLPDGFGEEISALEDEILEDEKSISLRIERAETKCNDGCREAQQAAKDAYEAEMKRHEDWAADLRAKVEAQIAEDLEETHAKIRESQTNREEVKEAFLEEKNTEITESLDEQKDVEAKKVELAELKAKAEESIRARTLHEQAERFEEEADELKEKSDRLTGALKALDAWRRTMLEDLPIEGLEVGGKTIKVDGVPFDQLNTAKKMEIAVKIACLRAKDRPLPVIWVDGAEALDRENFNALIKYLEKEPVQCLIGAVTDEPIAVQNMVK